MDANGLRFWTLSRKEDWLPPAGSTELQYCAHNGRLQLRSLSTFSAPVEDFAIATARLALTPVALDQFGGYARWDRSSGHVVAGGGAPGETPILAPPANADVTDLVLGYDGILYVAAAGKLILVDRRGRWPDFTLDSPGVAFWRLAAHPDGGIVALDRDKPQLLRVVGEPLAPAPPLPRSPDVLLSCEENHNPPRVSLAVPLPAGEFFTALAVNAEGRFALLSWGVNTAANQAVFIRTFNHPELLSAPMPVAGVQFPYAIAWLPENRLALLASGTKEALVYDLDETAAALPPAGETYILADRNVGPFAHSFDPPPQYSNGPELAPLLPLSLNSLASHGIAQNQQPIDGGAARTTWHRLFVEAVIPPHCGAIAWLAAADKREDLPAATDTARWFPHIIGAADAPAGFVEVPQALWLRQPSEIPFHPGLLGGASEKDVSGLFMVLVQRAGRAVRSLQGRYLSVRLEIFGNHRATPAIAALRVHASRFSYVDHYLPEIYREDSFGPAADLPGQSTRPDFLQRFTAIFETQLTRMEDRVAAAHVLTRPSSTPDGALDWLGSWVGVEPEPEPAVRRRARLAATPQLYRQRGTLSGIRHALDIETGGLCSRGAVILLEDYRLRHTFATILGADLSIQNDPLLPGSWASPNSFVGDTLFLGDEHRKEFLSLFAPDIQSAKEQHAIDRFFDQLAHRLTLFIHDQVEPVDQNLVRHVAAREKPAHVQLTLRRATQPFLIGLASLLGINTYLAPQPPPGVARVNVSQIGGHDFITHIPSLDPRYEDGVARQDYGRPLARLSAPAAVLTGAAITLDASGSAAPPGRAVSTYRWSLNP